MSRIYYAITPTTINVTRYVKSPLHDLVYDRIMFLTEDHGTAEAAEAWCELASVGEVYEHDQFTIEIIECDE